MTVLRDLVVLLLLVGASGLAQKVAEDPTLVYIGTYTGAAGASGAPGASKGIYLFRLQSQGDEVFQNVTLVPLGLAAETPNPTFIELDLKRRVLYAVNEIEQGTVSAFAIDRAGKLTPLNVQSSKGSRPCQVALDKSGRHLLVANCGSGSVAVLPVNADGRLGDASDIVQVGKSTLSVSFDRDGRFAFVCDPASDQVRLYRFDADKGKLTPAPVSLALKAGAAPRHVVFRQDGRFAYVANEKSSTITVIAYDPAAGTLTEVQTVSTVPEYFDGPNIAGELWFHRSSRWLYVANVGHNSVVQFTVDKDKGTLTYVEEQGTGGKASRFFGIEPSSKHLAISNRDSDTVLASRIDEGNGRLKPSGIFATLGSPASVRFLPPASAVTEP
jgi:6-phosphogluconolactonase